MRLPLKPIDQGLLTLHVPAGSRPSLHVTIAFGAGRYFRVPHISPLTTNLPLETTQKSGLAGVGTPFFLLRSVFASKLTETKGLGDVLKNKGNYKNPCI